MNPASPVHGRERKLEPKGSPTRSGVSGEGQQAETLDALDQQWAEHESGFGIPSGTLELVEVPRKQWKRPVKLPLPPPSPREAPILQEFSRPWYALRLPLPQVSSDTTKVEESFMKSYDSQYTAGEPTFASELQVSSFLEPRVAVTESQAFLITPRIRFMLGTIEPLICRMLVYDISSGSRVTEEFCFRIPGPMLDKLDCSILPTALVYVLPKMQLQNLYLVMKVTKVLVGDSDHATMPYCTPEKYNSPAEQQKLVEKAAECCKRLGRFQQPLAWGAIPLAKCLKRSMTLYRQRTCIHEEQRLALISEAVRGTLKEKIIPAQCEIDIDQVPTEELNNAKFGAVNDCNHGSSLESRSLEIADPLSEHMDASRKLKSEASEQESPTKGKGVKSIWCREVQPFCPPTLVPTFGLTGSGPVALSYMNTLYLYPLQIEKCQYRNLAIRVQLLEEEIDTIRGVEEAGRAVLRAVYRAGNLVDQSAFATVGYHQKNPQFEDEFKICLPESLAMGHHLLFTFYHVHCKKLQPNQPQQELIGYTVLPLLGKNGTILQDGKFTANIIPAPAAPKLSTPGAILLPPGYVGAIREGAADNAKTMFSCRSRVISSIHSQDSAVADFLMPFHGSRVPISANAAVTEEDTIVSRLTNLNQSSAPNVRFFFLMIAKFVLGYLRYGTSIVRWSAFRTLLTVMEKASWNPSGSLKMYEMNRVLHDFVHIVFDESSIDNPSGPTTTSGDSPTNKRKCYPSVFSALLETWLNVLNNKASSENAEAKHMSLMYSNVLLQLILKSMAMHLLGQCGTQNSSTPRSLPMILFRNDQVMLERVLCQLITCKSDGLVAKKEVNRSVAYFCRGIFLVVKNGLPARVLNYYMREVDVDGSADSMRHVWLPFLNILIDFEFFPTVNGAALPDKKSSVKVPAWLAETIFKKLLLVVDSQKEHSIRVYAMRLLRRMFAAQAYNPRFQCSEQQEAIALLYYPFIPSVAQFATQGKILSFGTNYTAAVSVVNNVGDSTRLAGDSKSMHDLQKDLLACVAHLLYSVSIPQLPLFFRAESEGTEEKHQVSLDFTDTLTYYHRVIEKTSWNVASTSKLEINDTCNNSDTVTEDITLRMPSRPNDSLYDEARVHACLTLIQRMLDTFLVTENNAEQLWQRLLSPDLSARDTETGLSLLEQRLAHRRSFHRRTGGVVDTSTVLMSKDIVGNSASPSEVAQNTSSGSAPNKSLPRNWGKHYANSPRRGSHSSAADEDSISASDATSNKLGGATGADHDTNVVALQHAVAFTAMRVLQTAVDQFEVVIRLIEVTRRPQLGTHCTIAERDTPLLGAVSTSQALVFLGSIVELLYQLLQQTSSIPCLRGEPDHDVDKEGDFDVDTLDSSQLCFVASLLLYLQTFVGRFSAALFAARIPGLPLVHDQRRIQLLIFIATTAKARLVRQHATMLMSQLLAVCYEQTGSFFLVTTPILKVLTSIFFPIPSRTELPIAISTTSLRDLLDEMRTFATTSRGSVLSVPLHFHTQFIELINDLTAKVHAYERWRDAFESPDGAHDFEEIEEGIDRVVDDISRHWLLEEKLVWLNALMRLHVRRDRFAEAACCKIAAIKYVQLGGSNTLVRVQQWVVQELLLARNYAKQADWIDKELAICEQLLVRLKQQQRFREYQETLQYVNTVINRFAERQEGGSQYVSSVFSFYRVQYAGGCVSARIARDEYIYKRSKFMSLGEFVSETKTMLRAKYPQCERVDVIPEPKPLVGNETNPYVIFLRVTTVEEASTGELVLLKMPERRGLSWFKFAVPFALGSSTSYGKTSEQMKRITYLSVERTFPCRLSRQRVLMRHEVLRCPIDNSMDDIRKRCSLLRIELDNERVGKTDLKSLTLVLKGSVDTHVHGGIPEILDSFLVADPTNLFDVHGHGMSSHDSLQKRHELANLLVEFANLCWQCLRVSREAFNRSNHPNPSQLHLPLPPNHSRHAEPSSSQPENKKPDGSFLPPLSDELASFATIDKLAMSPTALPVDTESSQPLIEVSPLQTEFERSFAALVEQIRSKIAFAYRNAPDLERLYQQTMRLRTKQLPVSPPPAPTILTNMNTPAAVSPLPTQNTLPSPPAPTLSSNSAE